MMDSELNSPRLRLISFLFVSTLLPAVTTSSRIVLHLFNGVTLTPREFNNLLGCFAATSFVSSGGEINLLPARVRV